MSRKRGEEDRQTGWCRQKGMTFRVQELFFWIYMQGYRDKYCQNMEILHKIQ